MQETLSRQTKSAPFTGTMLNEGNPFLTNKSAVYHSKAHSSQLEMN